MIRRPFQRVFQRGVAMGIGFRELLVILVIALVIFGAKRLKTIGSDLGGAVKGFKKAMNDDEKPADPTVTPAQPVPPVQPQTTQSVNQPHTIDVQAQKVEEPIRKDV